MTMLKTKSGKKARAFAVELKSRSRLKNVTLSNGSRGVLIEGTLGALQHADFVDGVVLEIAGENGVLRVDLTRDDLGKHASDTEEGGQKC